MGVMYRTGENKVRPGSYRRFENSGVKNAKITNAYNGNSQNDFTPKHSYITLLDTNDSGNMYKLAVADGKLTMWNDAPSWEHRHITLIDTNDSGKLYKIAVTDGKLTMTQDASDGERSHIELTDTVNPNDMYKLAVVDGKLTMEEVK